MRPPSFSAPTPAPPTRARLLTTARTAALFGVLSALVVALVAARWGPLLSFDHSSADTLHHWAVADRSATRVNRVFTDWVWDPWTMRLLTAAAVIVVWRRGDRTAALCVAAASVLSAVLQQGLKSAVGRARPHWPDPVDSAHYAAFPSGHAMTATVACGLLLWLLWHREPPRWVWIAAVAVAAVSVAGVGFTRLWLGVHWFSDVLGGWLLGVFLVALTIAAYGRLSGRR
ncbi:phosphatase PAP2 family protein [Streptomyces sp. NPDC051569]|uniref:phosphatase PAP2 family protein n=1 Tax=Streptomyces sp. NPDC051569 TaxID=3365661 RepID=UPI0037A68767